MKQAKIVQCGPATTMESNRAATQVITDLPWAIGGQTGPWTAFYLEPGVPEYPTGTPIEWDHHHAVIAGITYPRLSHENEYNPDAPFH